MTKRKSMADRLREQGQATVSKLEDARNKLRDMSLLEAESQPENITKNDCLAPRYTIDETIDERIDETIDRTIYRTIDISNVSSIVSPNVSSNLKSDDDIQTTSKISSNVSPIVSSSNTSTVNKTDFFVIECLRILDGRPTTIRRMAESIDISGSTIKSSIQRLRKRGIIKDYDGKVFVLNQRCFTAKVSQIELNLSGDMRKIKAKIKRFNTENLSVISSNVSSNLYSSSSYIKKTTTISECLNENPTIQNLDEILNNDPELTFWKYHSVDGKQIYGWMCEYGVNFPKMIQNLRYARWKIENENVKIHQSVADYFYGILKKSGGTVNKPIDYKSFVELENETMDKWRAEILAQTQKRAELRKKRLDARIDTVIETLDLDDPTLIEAISMINSDTKRKNIQQAIEAGKPLDEKLASSLKGVLRRLLGSN